MSDVPMPAEAQNLAHLRHAVTEARIALRGTKDLFDAAKLTIEQKIIDDAGGGKALGTNEAERSRKIAIALVEDEQYAYWLQKVRADEAQVERLTAQLDTAVDERRRHEWFVRERLVDCLHELQHRTEQGALDEHATDIAIGATAKATNHRILRQPLAVPRLEDDGELRAAPRGPLPPPPRRTAVAAPPPDDEDRANDALQDAAAAAFDQRLQAGGYPTLDYPDDLPF